MYTPYLVEADIIIFWGYNNLLITSNTLVFFILLIYVSNVNGVYPVIKKWHLGVGTNDAINYILNYKIPKIPTKSLFIYEGNLRVLVDALMTVETREFIYVILGF
jgi:hypothetical protein